MRIALFGGGYFPYLTAGHTNFYFRLTPFLKERCNEVIVLSVNDQNENLFLQDTSGGPIKIYNFKRPLHAGDLSRFYGEINGLSYYHHRHRFVQELSEKFLTVYLNQRRIREILASHKTDIVYFMDNFGFGMNYMRKALGVKVGFAAANYERRGVLYDIMQSHFLKKLDLVIPFSNAYKTILARLGLAQDKLHVIRWGVDTSKLTYIPADRKLAVRQEYGVGKDKWLVLWTGYIQQIREPDFYMAIDCAKQMTARCNNIEFVFCLKPETYKPKYALSSSDRIRVINSIGNFRELLGSADILMSPVQKLDSTVAPPLTWAESMAMGVPVITTKVLGSDEIIKHEKTGFVTKDYDTLAGDLLDIRERGIDATIPNAARDMVKNNYDLKVIADRYASAFRSIL